MSSLRTLKNKLHEHLAKGETEEAITLMANAIKPDAAAPYSECIQLSAQIKHATKAMTCNAISFEEYNKIVAKTHQGLIGLVNDPRRTISKATSRHSKKV